MSPELHPLLFGPDVTRGPVLRSAPVLSGAIRHALETGHGCVALYAPLSPIWPPDSDLHETVVNSVTLVADKAREEHTGKRWRVVRFASQSDLDRYRAWLKQQEDRA